MTSHRDNSPADHSTSNPGRSSSEESESEGSRPTGRALQVHVDPSQPIPTSTKARAKRRIAALEEELETLRQERGTKQRYVCCHGSRECLGLI
jgi:hypothetical protein